MYDLLLKNGTVYDGTGTKGFKADVAVQDGKIAAVAASIDPALAAQTVDVTGLIVAPGFVDIHSHSDICFINDDRCEAKLYQGVTSELSGQCGSSVFPCLPERKDKFFGLGETKKGNVTSCSLADFLKGVEERGDRMSTNLLPLVGHGTLRAGVIGYEDRKLTHEELMTMRKLLADDMKTGAWGMSLGLGYTPGVSADQDELCQLGLEIEPYDGIITSHLRDQGAGTPKSLEEMFAINRYSGAHVHIAHYKCNSANSLGRSAEWVDLVHNARANGVNVTADLYPYTASSSGITNSFPKWAIKGGKKHVLEVVEGPEYEKLMEELRAKFSTAEQAESLLVVYTNGVYPEMDGKTLEQISKEWKMDRAETLVKLTIDTGTNSNCISFCMSDEDADYMMAQNDFCIGSDGYCLPYDPALNHGRPHPRSFGTFPRFLRLAREKGFCTPEVAVRRITGQSADYIGIKDRGYIKTGLVADITVFDWNNVTDKATYVDPFQKPEGIVHVIMDGKFAIKDGVQTEERLGKILLKK